MKSYAARLSQFAAKGPFREMAVMTMMTPSCFRPQYDVMVEGDGARACGCCGFDRVRRRWPIKGPDGAVHEIGSRCYANLQKGGHITRQEEITEELIYAIEDED